MRVPLALIAVRCSTITVVVAAEVVVIVADVVFVVVIVGSTLVVTLAPVNHSSTDRAPPALRGCSLRLKRFNIAGKRAPTCGFN